LLAILAGLAASPLGEAVAPPGCAAHLPYGAPTDSVAASEVRTWACAFGVLYVITGTVSRSAETGDAGPKIYRVNSGAHRVAVPSAFYKLLFSEAGGGQAMAVVYGNPDPGSPAPAPTLRSVDDLEALSGLDFFPGMAEERQRRIEAAAPDVEFWEGRVGAAGHCT
jgi:DNA/RNA endonuclease G (NUC1)